VNNKEIFRLWLQRMGELPKSLKDFLEACVLFIVHISGICFPLFWVICNVLHKAKYKKRIK